MLVLRPTSRPGPIAHGGENAIARAFNYIGNFSGRLTTSELVRDALQRSVSSLQFMPGGSQRRILWLLSHELAALACGICNPDTGSYPGPFDSRFAYAGGSGNAAGTSAESLRKTIGTIHVPPSGGTKFQRRTSAIFRTAAVIRRQLLSSNYANPVVSCSIRFPRAIEGHLWGNEKSRRKS